MLVASLKKVLLCGMCLIVSLSVAQLGAQECALEVPDNKTESPVVIKVFTLKNMDASVVRLTLNELFGMDGSEPSKQAEKAKQDLISQLACSIDQRTNSLIISGAKSDLIVVEHLLKRLDVRKPQPVETIVYRLRNAPASDVAESIKAWLNEKLVGDENSGKFVIVPELVSNSLIVSNNFDEALASELEQAIKALDTATDMVHVRMVIKKTVDGKEVVLANPAILTVDQQRGSISIGTKTDSLTIELTPQVLRKEDRESTRVTRIPAETNKR